MLNEITKKEFEERYPEVSTYGLEAYSPVYLDQCRSQTKWTTTAKFYSGKQLATKKSFKSRKPRQAAALLGFFILY